MADLAAKEMLRELTPLPFAEEGIAVNDIDVPTIETLPALWIKPVGTGSARARRSWLTTPVLHDASSARSGAGSGTSHCTTPGGWPRF